MRQQLGPAIAGRVSGTHPHAQDAEGVGRTKDVRTGEDLAVQGLGVKARSGESNRAEGLDVSLVVVEFRADSKGGLVQALDHLRHRVEGGEEEVDIISVEERPHRGETVDGKTLEDRSKAHSQRLDAEVKKQAREGVTLTDAAAKGEPSAVTTINADTGVTSGDKITDAIDEVGIDTHRTQHADEPAEINAIVGFGLIEANEEASSASYVS